MSLFPAPTIPIIPDDENMLFCRQKKLLGTLLEYLKYLTFLGRSGNQCQPNLEMMTLIWIVRIVIVTKIVMMRSSGDLVHQFCR
jgi:hypothetical protein